MGTAAQGSRAEGSVIDLGALVEGLVEAFAGGAGGGVVEWAIDPVVPARVMVAGEGLERAVMGLLQAAGAGGAAMEVVLGAGAGRGGLVLTVVGAGELVGVDGDDWRAIGGELAVEGVGAKRAVARGALWPQVVEEAVPPLPKRLVGRALVVEGHAGVRSMLVHGLEGAGYVCDEAATFDEALRRAGAARAGYALVLIDGDLRDGPAPAAAMVLGDLLGDPGAARGAVVVSMAGRRAVDGVRVAKPVTRSRLAAVLAQVGAGGGAGAADRVASAEGRSPAVWPAERWAAPAARAAERPAAPLVEPPIMPAAESSPLDPSMITLDPGLADLLPDFVRNRAVDIERLRAARLAGDEATVRRICHGIKGCGGAFGFPRLSALAADIGQMTRDGRLAETASAIESLGRLVVAIGAAIGVKVR